MDTALLLVEAIAELVDGPEDERTAIIAVHHGCRIVRCIPPAPDDDTTTRENESLMSPEVIEIGILESIVVLHEGDALPSGDTVLRAQGVDPSGEIEFLVVVVAVAIDTD